MAASDKILGALHEQLARVMSKMLEPQERFREKATGEKDSDGEPIFEDVMYLEYPPANVLAVAAKFLKDNNITATIESDPLLTSLTEKLKKRGRVSDADVKEALAASGNALLQ